ncbi:hypothetical protein PTKIN_Ptkin17bG0135200 [Pterospermum kingtungense]
MLSYVILIINHLKLAWNLLLSYCLCPNIHYMQEYFPGVADHQQLGTVRHKCSDDEEEVACAVCLCKIEEDDEMRELRCDHLFHKACLDRWLRHSFSTTCPICRTSLTSTPPKLVAGVHVLTFNYCTFTSNHRDNWWLR